MHLFIYFSLSDDIIITSFSLYEFEDHKVIFRFDCKAMFSDYFWRCFGETVETETPSLGW